MTNNFVCISQFYQTSLFVGGTSNGLMVCGKWEKRGKKGSRCIPDLNRLQIFWLVSENCFNRSKNLIIVVFYFLCLFLVVSLILEAVYKCISFIISIKREGGTVRISIHHVR